MIGVLVGSGGISDMVQAILATCDKDTGARVLYDEDPRRLIQRLLEVYRLEHHRRPSVFCRRAAEAQPTSTDGSQQDVVCRMWVASGKAAARRTTSDQRFVFCSLQCAARFDADRQQYEANPANTRHVDDGD